MNFKIPKYPIRKLWKGLQGSGRGSPSVSWQERKRCVKLSSGRNLDLLVVSWVVVHVIFPKKKVLGFRVLWRWHTFFSRMHGRQILKRFSKARCAVHDMWAEALQEYLWDSTGREASAHGKIREFCHCSQQTRLPFDISCRPSRAWPLLLPSSTCRMFATRRGSQVQSIFKKSLGNLIQCSRSLTLNESGATGASCSASTGAPLVWRSSCDGWVA